MTNYRLHNYSVNLVIDDLNVFIVAATGWDYFTDSVDCNNELRLMLFTSNLKCKPTLFVYIRMYGNMGKFWSLLVFSTKNGIR